MANPHKSKKIELNSKIWVRNDLVVVENDITYRFFCTDNKLEEGQDSRNTVRF